MSKSVLVLEESQTIQGLVTSTLQISTLQIYQEQDSSRFLARAKQLKPDLILISNSDGRNNYVTCKELRKDQDLCNVPLLLLAKARDRIDTKQLQQLKINGLIQIPFEAATLQEEVKQFIPSAFLMPAAEAFQQAQSFDESPQLIEESIKVFDDEMLDLLKDTPPASNFTDDDVPEVDFSEEIEGPVEEDEELMVGVSLEDEISMDEEALDASSIEDNLDEVDSDRLEVIDISESKGDETEFEDDFEDLLELDLSQQVDESDDALLTLRDEDMELSEDEEDASLLEEDNEDELDLTDDEILQLETDVSYNDVSDLVEPDDDAVVMISSEDEDEETLEGEAFDEDDNDGDVDEEGLELDEDEAEALFASSQDSVILSSADDMEATEGGALLQEPQTKAFSEPQDGLGQLKQSGIEDQLVIEDQPSADRTAMIWEENPMGASVVEEDNEGEMDFEQEEEVLFSLSEEDSPSEASSFEIPLQKIDARFEQALPSREELQQMDRVEVTLDDFEEDSEFDDEEIVLDSSEVDASFLDASDTSDLEMEDFAVGEITLEEDEDELILGDDQDLPSLDQEDYYKKVGAQTLRKGLVDIDLELNDFVDDVDLNTYDTDSVQTLRGGLEDISLTKNDFIVDSPEGVNLSEDSEESEITCYVSTDDELFLDMTTEDKQVTLPHAWDRVVLDQDQIVFYDPDAILESSDQAVVDDDLITRIGTLSSVEETMNSDASREEDVFADSDSMREDALDEDSLFLEDESDEEPGLEDADDESALFEEESPSDVLGEASFDEERSLFDEETETEALDDDAALFAEEDEELSALSEEAEEFGSDESLFDEEDDALELGDESELEESVQSDDELTMDSEDFSTDSLSAEDESSPEPITREDIFEQDLEKDAEALQQMEQEALAELDELDQEMASIESSQYDLSEEPLFEEDIDENEMEQNLSDNSFRDSSTELSEEVDALESPLDSDFEDEDTEVMSFHDELDEEAELETLEDSEEIEDAESVSFHDELDENSEPASEVGSAAIDAESELEVTLEDESSEVRLEVSDEDFPLIEEPLVIPSDPHLERPSKRASSSSLEQIVENMIASSVHKALKSAMPELIRKLAEELKSM
ncbi:hypothetical protein WDW89_21230 [Deltaproteobacteria bacterium TL4]